MIALRKRLPSAEQRELAALLLRQEASVRSAIRAFLADVRSDEVIREVRLLIEGGRIEDAMRLVDTYVVRLGTVIPKIFVAAATDQADKLNEQVPRVAVAFDPGDPQAAELMRQNQLQFVVGFQAQQREATRLALAAGLQEGIGTVEMARRFIDSIGLTAGQEAAVQNYRRLLTAGSSEALSRDLRDRRFDPSVRRAAAGEPLGADQVDKMVARYRARALQYRAEVIARTESVKVTGLAREEAMRQTLQQTGIAEGAVVRTWMATLDERVRDTHRAMNKQARGLGEAFQSPSGAMLMFPGDPSAPPEEIINCRCVLGYSVQGLKKPKPEEVADKEPSAISSKEGLQRLVGLGADEETLSRHPLVQAAIREMAAVKPTSEMEGFGTPAWWRDRDFVFPEGKITGLDQATGRIVDRFMKMGWVDDDMAAGEVLANKEATVILGPPASGKSTFANAIARAKNAAIIDSDAVKSMLPEYGSGIGANAVHEESDIITRRVFDAMRAEGVNVVIPKVGGTLAGIERLVESLKASGYRVNIVNVAVDKDTAFRRMIGRFLSTGRLVNTAYMREVGDGPSRTYAALKRKGIGDAFAEIDNNGPRGSPAPITEDGGRLLAGIKFGP